VEEWAEAMMLIHWIEFKEILLKSKLLFVNSVEYVGALSDFTGEVGRLAVIQAANRDIEGVEAILQVDLIISLYLHQFSVLGGLSKKVLAVNTNLKKVEDILYELKLQKMGGKALRRDPEPVEREVDGITEA
jgi:predicted translin family RNA/ssDNA-binding protein